MKISWLSFIACTYDCSASWSHRQSAKKMNARESIMRNLILINIGELSAIL